MPRRYLFGPVTAAFADQNLHGARHSESCLAFNRDGTDLTICQADTWQSITARLPAGWRPDFIVLPLAHTHISRCLWSAPIPIIGLATDWHLLWHRYRRRLRSCDLVLTDAEGAKLLAREGIPQGRAINLNGCRRAFIEATPPSARRDTDILVLGDLRPATAREQLPWLSRIARLGQRWRVAMRTPSAVEEDRQLSSRARIVFHPSHHGECGQTILEAAASGALVFVEAGNREVPSLLRDRQECVFYTPGNLEALLNYYLEHEAERRRIADAAQTKVSQLTFADLWDGRAPLYQLAGRSACRTGS